MAHPRMYNDDDPYLADVRRVCLELPESVEVEAWGRPTFRAGKKIFSVLTRGEHDDGSALIFKPEPDERAALVDDDRIFSPPYFGPAGWLAITLTDDTDWGEITELLDGSYRQVALKRMLKALDG